MGIKPRDLLRTSEPAYRQLARHGRIFRRSDCRAHGPTSGLDSAPDYEGNRTFGRPVENVKAVALVFRRGQNKDAAT